MRRWVEKYSGCALFYNPFTQPDYDVEPMPRGHRGLTKRVQCAWSLILLSEWSMLRKNDKMIHTYICQKYLFDDGQLIIPSIYGSWQAVFNNLMIFESTSYWNLPEIFSLALHLDTTQTTTYNLMKIFSDNCGNH